MTCAQCNGTGSRSKQLDGFLDCVHCDAAEERTKLESWSKGQLAVAPSAAAWAWMIYLHGKAAVKPAAPVAPEPVKHVPQPRMVERECSWCKGAFKARAADVARGWGKFCSKSCKASRQEKNTGQYRALIEREDDDEYGHIFASGYDGHGQD